MKKVNFVAQPIEETTNSEANEKQYAISYSDQLHNSSSISPTPGKSNKPPRYCLL